MKDHSWHEFSEGRYDFEGNEFLGFLQHQSIAYSDNGNENGQKTIDLYYGKDRPELQGLLRKKSIYGIGAGMREFLYSEIEEDFRAQPIQSGMWLRYLRKHKQSRLEPGENVKVTETEFCNEWDIDTKVVVSRLEKRLKVGKVDKIIETVFRKSDWLNWRSAQVALSASYVPVDNDFKRVGGQYLQYLNNVIDQVYVWDDRAANPKWTQQIDVGRNAAGDIEDYLDAGGRKVKIFYKPEAPFLLDRTEETVSDQGSSHVLTQEYAWDYANGGKLSVSKDANGHEAHYRWDGLGRILGIKGPGSEEEEYAFKYTWGDAANYGRIEIWNRALDLPLEIQYIDGQMQVIANVRPGKTGYILSNYREKDVKGRVVSEINAMPLADNSIDTLSNAQDYVFRNTYDAMDRPVTRRAPWAKVGYSRYQTASRRPWQ